MVINGNVKDKLLNKLSFFLVFLVFLSIFLFLQFQSPWLIGFDGYFHIKFSYLLREHGFIDRLPWLRYTIYNDYFRDHHLLFHYLLIPFTFGNLMTLGKIAASIFMAFAGFCLYILLRSSNVPYPAFITIVSFLSSSALLFRLEMLRIQSLSLAFLLIIFLLHYKKRYKLIFLFSMLFVYLYDAFPLVIMISLVFMLSEFVLGKKLNYRYLLYSSAGILTALIVNPYFPNNITSFFFNIYRTLFLKVEGIKLGSEWYPYSSWALIENMLLASAVFFLLVLFLPFVRNISREEFSALIIAILFLILTMKSRRFVEYSPVFIMLSASLIIGRRINRKILLLSIITLFPVALFNYYSAAKEIKNAPNPEIYEGSALWLMEHSREKEIVFNADWDDFPFLFFYNHKNYYIVGLDPMYMYKYDPELYRLYQRITKGKVLVPGRIIKEKFKASYIFVDRKHKKFIKQLKMDINVKKVYQDGWGIIYKIR